MRGNFRAWAIYLSVIVATTPISGSPARRLSADARSPFSRSSWPETLAVETMEHLDAIHPRKGRRGRQTNQHGAHCGFRPTPSPKKGELYWVAKSSFGTYGIRSSPGGSFVKSPFSARIGHPPATPAIASYRSQRLRARSECRGAAPYVGGFHPPSSHPPSAL